jgi:methylmalonyl-CoA mutase
VDSLTVACYDQGYDAPDEFSAHLARNTDTLLKEEALLDKVKDPLGGSYTVEALTRSLCEASWSIFQEIERRGGFEAAWKDGYIPGELDRIRVERGNLVSGRRRSIVGTTVYPNMKERRLEDVNWHGPRLQTEALPSGWTLATLPSPAALVGNVHTPTTALDPFRPSWPYENLRLRLERHMALGGKQPVILLALYGDPTFSRARAGFCLSLFGSAGYEVREHSFDHPEAIGDVVRLLGPDAVVLCAKDDEYLPAVRKIRCAVPLVIAGYPKDAVEELRAAGATDFVHVRQDLLETLSLWHQRFGIPEIPVDQPIDPRTK